MHYIDRSTLPVNTEYHATVSYKRILCITKGGKYMESSWIWKQVKYVKWNITVSYEILHFIFNVLYYTTKSMLQYTPKMQYLHGTVQILFTRRTGLKWKKERKKEKKIVYFLNTALKHTGIIYVLPLYGGYIC